MHLLSAFSGKPKEPVQPTVPRWDRVAPSELAVPGRSVAAPHVAEASSQADTIASHGNRFAIRSMVDAGATIHGSLECRNNTMIDGTVEGDVTVTASGNMLLIRQGATVHGNVHAATVLCAGTVVGDIEAESLRVFKTATLKGAVRAKQLGIDPGCTLDCTSLACGDLLAASVSSKATEQAVRPVRQSTAEVTHFDPALARASARI